MKNFLNSDKIKRIAFILLYLIDTFGYEKNSENKLSYTLSRKDFASIAGTAYETVIRTLIFLQQKKLIKIEGKDIYIPDENKIKQYALSNK